MIGGRLALTQLGRRQSAFHLASRQGVTKGHAQISTFSKPEKVSPGLRECRHNLFTLGRRLSSTSEANAVEPTSEETAQHLSQLLEQPLALESFITKELTVSQRQAIQRLLDKRDVVEVEVPEPSVHSLRLVAMNTAIPFVGFGIMDNMM